MLTHARWPWNHAVIIAITGHHVFQSVWALTNAHFTSKVCLFSNVKVLWVASYLAFFYYDEFLFYFF